MHLKRPGLIRKTRARLENFRASQAALHSSADKKRLRRAGWVIILGIAVGSVGAITQWQAKFFFNAMIVSMIVAQGIIGACSLPKQARWSYFLMGASLASLAISLVL